MNLQNKINVKKSNQLGTMLRDLMSHLLLEIEQLINSTISELATSENYDLILYENAAYVSDEVNITKKVIERIQKLSL